jgi:hypothetical protein
MAASRRDHARMSMMAVLGEFDCCLRLPPYDKIRRLMSRIDFEKQTIRRMYISMDAAK